MGYTRHNAIVITATYDFDRVYAGLLDLQERMAGMEGLAIVKVPIRISEPSPAMVNGVRSCIVWPDGSNEGWPESDQGDAFRDLVVDYLETLRYEDGSSPVQWVEVQFGDERRVTTIIRHSDEPERRARRTDG